MNPILLRRWLSVWLFGSLLLGRSWADPVPQTLEWISPPPGTLLRLGQNYPLGATASSGLPVTFRVAAGPASITDGQVTVTNSGRVTLVAEQSGSVQWTKVSSYQRHNRGRVGVEPIGGVALGGDWTADSFSLAVAKGFAFAGSVSGLRVVDVRNPAAPRVLGTFPTSGRVSDIRITETHALLATGAGLDILDISDPSQPTAVAHLPIGGNPFSLSIKGGIAYVAAGASGVWLVDISQPDHPRKISEVLEPSVAFRDVAVVGDKLFVGTEWSGVRAYDVSRPASPIFSAKFGNLARAEIETVDGMLWVADSLGTFQVWDIESLAAPQVRGSCHFPYGSSPFGNGMRMFLSGRQVFLTEQTRGLQMVESSDPDAPEYLGVVADPFVNAVHAEEGVLYLARNVASLQLGRLRELLPQNLLIFLPPLAPFGQSVPLVAASDSGLPVKFSIVSGPGVIEGTNLVASEPGIVTVRAEQSGDEQFSPASTTRIISYYRAGTPLGWAVDPSFQLDPAVWGQISSLVVLTDGSIVAGGPGLATAEYVDQFNGQIVQLSADGALFPNLPSCKEAARKQAPLATIVQVARTQGGDLLGLTQTRTGGGFDGYRYFSMLFRLSAGDTEWRYETYFSKAVAMFPDLAGGVFVGGGNNEFIPGTAGSAWFLALGRLGADFQADPRFTLPAEYGPSGGGPSSIKPLLSGYKSLKTNWLQTSLFFISEGTFANS